MPELTYSSAGVGTREIDLSQPSRLGPQGTPACVIGPASRGPAFVPVTIGDFKEFVAQFGESDGERFAPLAVNEWLKNAQSLTYVRTLGVGKGTGADEEAGFVAGAALPNSDTGLISAAAAKNKYSTGVVEGSSYLINAYMTDSSGAAVLSDAEITETLYSTGPSAAAATLVDAIDTTGIAALDSFTLTVPIAAGGDGVTYTFLFNSTTLVNANEDAETYGISTTWSGGRSEDETALDIIDAINQVDSVGVKFGANDCADVGITGPDLGITATLGSSPTQITLTMDTAGTAGNVSGVLAEVVGFETTLLLESSFLGGVDASTGTCALVTRAMVMTPFGVTLTVGSYDSTTRTSTLTLVDTTDVDDTAFKFSLDPTNAYYIANVLNTEPTLIEEKGHCLYMHHEIDENQMAVAPVGTALTEMIVAENAGSLNDNYKKFVQRFDHAKTPWVKSQSFGSDKFDLFRVHALSDGEFENSNIKISIINLKYDSSGSWGTFDLVVRAFDDNDAGQKHIERFSSLNLDPTSSNFIAKKIGDKRTWFNFDKPTQQLQTSGTYDNVSKYIRIELSDDVSQSQIPVNAIPFGHAAYEEMIVSDSAFVGGSIDGTPVTANNLPLPYRQNVAVGLDLKKKSYSKLHWGLQLSVIQDLDEPNESLVQSSIVKNIVKFLPSTIVATTGHEFTLENIEANVRDSIADADERAIDWKESNYRYDSALDDATTVTRFLKATDITGSTNSAYTKFTMLMQGGFDGTNIFREQKAKMQNAAVVWEMEDASNQFGTSGPTVVAYRKALDVITSKSDVEIQILAVPGIRHSAVTQYAIDAVESRFDALYIADILEKDSNGDTILSETQITDVGQTIAQFVSEGYDSSFGAAYFPDVVMTDPITKTQLRVPPSVAVLGAMALNDAIAHPWYAPAGFTRGALKSVEDTSASFSRANLDDLYDAKINPITSFPGTEVVIWGQKTMLQAASALDRVNVRRLLIAIRRAVKNIALSFLFEPNRAETLAAFESRVNPLLQGIQEKSGLDRYKVKIDTETTTQMDVENNTLRGKIYIQPTKTAEFISLDFVVSNTL